MMNLPRADRAGLFCVVLRHVERDRVSGSFFRIVFSRDRVSGSFLSERFLCDCEFRAFFEIQLEKRP